MIVFCGQFLVWLLRVSAWRAEESIFYLQASPCIYLLPNIITRIREMFLPSFFRHLVVVKKSFGNLQFTAPAAGVLSLESSIAYLQLRAALAAPSLRAIHTNQ